MPSALVTGGSSGIGLAIARMLREEGYALTLAARKPERLEAAAAELGATAVAADVRHEEDCARLVAGHVEAHGGLDVLVNSAGVGRRGAHRRHARRSTSTSSSRSTSAARSSSRARRFPRLREARGYVVNLASIAGTIPAPGLAVYGAAKAALISLTRTLDREEADAGVRFTALCPGFVDTPMASWTGLEAEEMIRPEDCAELVRALLRLGPATRVPVLVVERAGGDTA